MLGKKIGGRQKGTPNKLTATVKEAFQAAFDELQQDPATKLSAWGKENPTDFYKVASKLIPTEVSGSLTIQESAVDLLEAGRKRNQGA